MKTGEEETKTGSWMPSPFNTVLVAARVIFFNEKALYSLFLNSRHTFNLVCLFAVMLFVPYRDFSGHIVPDGVGQILENLVLTMIFICLLFMYMPKKLVIFTGFMRVMLAFELTDVLMTVSLALKKPLLLHIFHPLFMAWYLSLVVFAVSKIKGTGYAYSLLLVFGSFLFVMLLPSII